jgi:hypothetical protein
MHQLRSASSVNWLFANLTRCLGLTILAVDGGVTASYFYGELTTP